MFYDYQNYEEEYDGEKWEYLERELLKLTRGYILKDEMAFKSLMFELEQEGCKWGTGEKPMDKEYDLWADAVVVESDRTIRFETIASILEGYLMNSNVDIMIINYQAKTEYIGYSFAEILQMDWDEIWAIRVSHPEIDKLSPDFSEGFRFFEEFLSDVADLGGAEQIHEIFKNGRFFIQK